ncbi:rubrerythrin family protein [Haloterrigena salinisoli]|uniref:rubrerythrin family protein n=1 Tax=Haloterrigena salinisoli TaxID=3132747 RepID=UPI0030D2CFA2
MDADEFRDAIEDSMDSELERLGSSKLLVALTDAELTEETVLRTVATSERTAAETFETWADDESHEDARETFAAFRDREREHYERVADLFEDGREEFEDDETAVGPMHERLRSLEATPERLGGAVGRALVGERTHLQVVSFFVNEGDERRADLFRELRSETTEQGDRALEVLADVCDGDSDWDRAREAAEDVIEVAYEAYADSLDDLGIDPKPIC